MDRDEDIVMIQYADHEGEGESLPRMVRWNENGFAIPIFEEGGSAADTTVPTQHPLLISRHNADTSGTVTRTARANRARRYQYLQLNTRTNNPPVILQRLLGPTAQNIHLGPNQILNSPGLRDSARVVVMDNFGIFPSVEEQIDFVDQSGYLFGPSMSATLNHVPVVLHWWKEESRYIDGESTFDAVTYVCNKLIPALLKNKNQEITERKRKTEQEDKAKVKQKPAKEAKQEDGAEAATATASTTASGTTAESQQTEEGKEI